MITVALFKKLMFTVERPLLVLQYFYWYLFHWSYLVMTNFWCGFI